MSATSSSEEGDDICIVVKRQKSSKKKKLRESFDGIETPEGHRTATSHSERHEDSVGGSGKRHWRNLRNVVNASRRCTSEPYRGEGRESGNRHWRKARNAVVAASRFRSDHDPHYSDEEVLRIDGPRRESNANAFIEPAPQGRPRGLTCVEALVIFPYGSLFVVCLYISGSIIFYKALGKATILGPFSPFLDSAQFNNLGLIALITGSLVIGFPFLAFFLIWFKRLTLCRCFGAPNDCRGSCLGCLSVFTLILSVAYAFVGAILLCVMYGTLLLSLQTQDICIMSEQSGGYMDVILLTDGLQISLDEILPSIFAGFRFWGQLETLNEAEYFCYACFQDQDDVVRLTFGASIMYMAILFALMASMTLYQSFNGVGYNTKVREADGGMNAGGMVRELIGTFFG